MDDSLFPAYSRAIAGLRQAVDRSFEHHRWLQQHATSKPLPPDDVLDYYHHPEGTWGPKGNWIASDWMASPWPTRRDTPSTRDPDWDGILVPKTPGKAKRRRQQRREAERERREAAEAAIAAAWDPSGWGSDIGWRSPGAGWGSET